jgi:hypothetical protein
LSENIDKEVFFKIKQPFLMLNPLPNQSRVGLQMKQEPRCPVQQFWLREQQTAQ